MGTTQRAAGVDYVLDLGDIDATQLALVGGKGASLGELSRVEGVSVPPGFCVTAEAFRRIVAPAIEDRLDRLSQLEPEDRDGIRAVSEEIRGAIEAIAIPRDLARRSPARSTRRPRTPSARAPRPRTCRRRRSRASRTRT
jgi:pyruvate,water dikinase